MSRTWYSISGSGPSLPAPNASDVGAYWSAPAAGRKYRVVWRTHHHFIPLIRYGWLISPSKIHWRSLSDSRLILSVPAPFSPLNFPVAPLTSQRPVKTERSSLPLLDRDT